MLVGRISVVLGCIVSLVGASPTCPLDGPVFPKPRLLSQSDAIKAAVANLTSTFANITAGAQNYSLSVQVFSADEEEPLFSVSHTAPNLPPNTTGVRRVDENTVFRLGSLTKIFTIYAFLINAGEKYWHEPVTNYIPELQAVANQSDPVSDIDWNDITLGGLATQMTGIPRECSYHARPWTPVIKLMGGRCAIGRTDPVERDEGQCGAVRVSASGPGSKTSGE